MATGIAQKSYKVLSTLWFLKKNDKWKLIKTKNTAEERLKALEGIVVLKVTKN